jgi:hypothetical protein
MLVVVVVWSVWLRNTKEEDEGGIFRKFVA